MVAAHSGGECWHRAQLVGGQRNHIGDAVDHHADDPRTNVENDHYREAVVPDLLQVELHAQVQDGHDHAAQIDHSFDERGRIGHAGGLLVGADFLHAQDVDAVLFGAELEGEELADGRDGPAYGCAAG